MYPNLLFFLGTLSFVAAQPVGLSSGHPAAGISGDLSSAASDLDKVLNLNNAPALERIRDNQALADTNINAHQMLAPRKLTDLGAGITSERLGVVPPSTAFGRTIGGHVAPVHSGFNE